jgi:hypothetical protein
MSISGNNLGAEKRSSHDATTLNNILQFCFGVSVDEGGCCCCEDRGVTLFHLASYKTKLSTQSLATIFERTEDNFVAFLPHLGYDSFTRIDYSSETYNTT